MKKPEVNHWFDDECARAYWDQHKALPYQQLLNDTAAWLEPQPGQRWLDLGCGGGQLTAAVWQRGRGQLEQIVSMDCAAVNRARIDKLRQRFEPAREDQFQFAVGNFSDGLPQFGPATFDGIVSGLAISYAEFKDPQTGRYTDFAYNRLLAELHRILKPGGTVVFSVPVPRPRFWQVFWKSLRAGWRVSKPGRALLNGLKMQRYGGWLQREAQRGRFHYYPIEDIALRLERVGFRDFKYRLSFADQAYLISVRKEPAAKKQAA